MNNREKQRHGNQARRINELEAKVRQVEVERQHQLIAAYTQAADDIKDWIKGVMDACEKEASFPDSSIGFTYKMKEYLDATD